MTVWLIKLLLLALAGVLFGRIAWMWWQDGRLRAQRRSALFDSAEDLFSDGRKRIIETGFPRIAGTYAGLSYDLQVTPDTLNYRKLPALWVLYTLTEPQPVQATLDIMMRPRGVEPFSNFARLPIQIEVPPGFPADCAIRTDNAAALPDLAAVLAATRALLADPQVKELVISPKGLRLVMLAEEANRTRYLLFRDAEMGTPLPRATIKSALDRLRDLAHTLASADTK